MIVIMIIHFIIILFFVIVIINNYYHNNLGLMSVTTEEKKKFDFEISHLEVILLVLVAFMEFIHINEVVMWFINKIVI